MLERPAALLPVAVVAVYGSVAPGKERDLGILAALSADRGMHLASHSAAEATTTTTTTTTTVITSGRASCLSA